MEKELRKKLVAGVMAVTFAASNSGIPALAAEFTEQEPDTESAAVQLFDEEVETIDEENTLEAEPVISNVVLTVGENEQSVTMNWCSTSTSASAVQYKLKSENSWKSVRAEEPVFVSNASYYSQSASINNLEPGNYEYRMVEAETAETVLAGPYSFTIQDSSKKYEFLVVGDPQIGSSKTDTDTKNWENTMQTAISKFPAASFLLSVGDQINAGWNSNPAQEMKGFLSEGTQLSSIPLASSVGNHDNGQAAVELYTANFNLPNVSSYGNTSDAVTGEENYSFVHGNTLFMMLNTNNSSIAEHKAFIEKSIAANKECTWRVVAFHQSIYSVASHVNDGNIAELRKGLSPVFAANDIDFVMMGHDHVYARSYIMGGVTGMQAEVTESAESEIWNPNGVQYITFNSGSGSKFYNITQELYTYTAVQNQERVPNYSHVEVTDKRFTVTTYRTTDNSVVDKVTIYKTDDTGNNLLHEVETTGTTSMNTATDKIEGYANITSELNITKVAEYNSGIVNEDGGSAEIVQYNKDNHMLYVVNGTSGTLDIVPRDAAKTGVKCDIKAELAKLRPDFVYGDMTSVAVNEKANLIAIAVQAEKTSDNGLVVFMNYDNEITGVVEAGVQPDMVIFTEDGNKVLAANEGEPRDGYASEETSDNNNGSWFPGGWFPGGAGQSGPKDPKGSVTIIDLSLGVENATVNEVTFEAYDEEEKRNTLVQAGVILKKDTKPSVDFEPEYIAIQGNEAYVTLQEANAVAVIDIKNGTVKAVNPMGYKNHSLDENGLDLKADGKIEISAVENVYGIYMPDAISAFKANGKNYVVTANEGDAREWGEEETEEYHCNEAKTKGINGEKVTVYDKTEYEGLDEDKTYIFGGRSFALYEIHTDGSMTQVYESASDFERITAELLPEYFNCSNDDVDLDSRSGKKGPEAEGITIGHVGSSLYAFIGLERIGGIMVYNITDPQNVKYSNYINTRAFTEPIAGDVSPEGLTFVPASESLSGRAELIAAHEVSGTVAVYELHQNTASTSGSVSAGGSYSGLNMYPVAVTSTEHAKVSVSCNSAKQGDKVTLTISADSGYHPQKITVTSTGEKLVEVSRIGLDQWEFVMPKGKVSIDVKMAQYRSEIVLQIGSKNAVLNGDVITTDASPFIENGRTLVPVRLIVEQLGGKVQWDNKTRTVTLTIEDNVLKMVIDEIIPGFDSSAIISGGRTYVPIRYIMEAVGANVDWISSSRQIVIVK